LNTIFKPAIMKRLTAHNNWFIIVFLIAIPFSVINAQVNEYTLKALYMEHFVTFIEWPEQSEFTDKNKPVVIGVYGKTSITTALQKTYSNKKIRNRQVIILPISGQDKFNQCQILFIGDLSERDLRQTINLLDNKPILTISENKGFAAKGVHINFYIQENNVRFEINDKAAINAGLHISHHLLKLAKLINNI